MPEGAAEVSMTGAKQSCLKSCSSVEQCCDLIHGVQHDTICWHGSGKTGSESPVEATGTALCHQFLHAIGNSRSKADVPIL